MAVALFVVLLIGGEARAVGELDMTFGTNGKVVSDLFGVAEGAAAMGVQADGKLVVAGSVLASSETRLDFVVARYHGDGDLDTTFGAAGRSRTDFQRDNDGALAMAMQTDGKIVVAGFTLSDFDDSDFALARYDSNGSLDASFGSDGKITLDFFGGIDEANAVVIQADGKIVVGGFAFNRDGVTNYFALARFNADGSPDTGFGENGKLITDFGGRFNAEEINALALQDDGKLIAAGFVVAGNGTEFALARYHRNGSLDASFGENGRQMINVFASLDEVNALAVQENGGILIAGSASSGASDRDFVLARCNANGSLDASFGNNGMAVIEFFGGIDEAYALALQADGGIVVAGGASVGGNRNFAIAKYRGTGALDTGFDTDGKVTTDFFVGFDVARAVAVLSNGNIVVVGMASNGNDTDFALARYLGD